MYILQYNIDQPNLINVSICWAFSQNPSSVFVDLYCHRFSTFQVFALVDFGSAALSQETSWAEGKPAMHWAPKEYSKFQVRLFAYSPGSPSARWRLKQQAFIIISKSIFLHLIAEALLPPLQGHSWRCFGLHRWRMEPWLSLPWGSTLWLNATDEGWCFPQGEMYENSTCLTYFNWSVLIALYPGNVKEVNNPASVCLPALFPSCQPTQVLWTGCMLVLAVWQHILVWRLQKCKNMGAVATSSMTYLSPWVYISCICM